MSAQEVEIEVKMRAVRRGGLDEKEKQTSSHSRVSKILTTTNILRKGVVRHPTLLPTTSFEVGRIKKQQIADLRPLGKLTKI
jgi:hypothetical protein